MASSYDTFKNLDLSKDEVERFTSALKDKEFRKLLVEYVEELQDPEHKKLYEEEITQLEKERGIDVTFINPVGGYVIKTSVNGNKKAFINICANENINKPTSSPAVKEGTKGLQWNLPHTIAPPREDIDNKKVRCAVYDVVYHPDTLHLAQKNKAFREMVNNTACEAVETNFDVQLDTKNLKFPKLKYKGMPHATVIRKQSKEQPPEMNPDEKEFMDNIFAKVGIDPSLKPETKPKQSKKAPKKGKEDLGAYTTPKYVIKHRSHIELDQFTEHKTAKINSAIPKELIIEIYLPLLKSSSDIVLDVAEKTLQLTSEKPAKYKLSLTLPYQVNENNGSAKFDKDLKRLIVALPVKRNTGILLSDLSREDSGVESDHGSPTSSSPPEEAPILTEVYSKSDEHRTRGENSAAIVKEFLDPALQYSLPEFSCHIFENTVALTLGVKNVDENSVCKVYNSEATAVHVKFTSISSGFYPTHYAVYIKLRDHFIDTDNVAIETWDNNVIVQMNFQPCDKIFCSYLIGIDEDSVTEKYIEEPSIVNALLENNKGGKISKQDSTEDDRSENSGSKKSKKDKKSKGDNLKTTTARQDSNESDCDVSEGNNDDKPSTKAIDIVGAYSESSGDELSYSYSPSKSRGILKRYSRSSVSRSVSESSIDDVMWASSIENCHTSLDSVIPEEGEMSTSLKKTVRFNDVVSRQLFRSNSSILGQRKKNQRKAKAKKRALERRYSESEVSETEDRKEREAMTNIVQENDYKRDGNKENTDFADDLFELDMNF